jgi:hypothetical protein
MARKRKASSLAVSRRRKAAKRLGEEWRNSASGRLDAEGASKSAQINRRIQWLAMEWHLPPCPRIGRTMTPALANYCQTHSISLDWLLCGDLKSLQLMMQARRGGKPPPAPPPPPPDSIKAKLARLSESEREVIEMVVDQLMDRP